MARMPTIISTRIPIRDGITAEHLLRGTDDIVAYYCPKPKCDWKFDTEKDRRDHARWKHGWCWECCKGFRTLRALDVFCVPSCQETFERPSDLLNHIESDECKAVLEKRISEHWFAHMMLVDQARKEQRSNDAKMYLASIDIKVITVGKQTAWIADPLGKFYEVAKLQDADGRIVYPYPKRGDDGVIRKGAVACRTCLTCGECWTDPGWYYHHLRGGHDKSFVVYKCDTCDAGFRWISQLMRHYEKGCEEKKMNANGTSIGPEQEMDEIRVSAETMLD
ncbi:hypothetical protein DRE_06508 [Drechslerella stenobrocha 248]|uniref:C2H2-type domain-containing protein n=1 Tax=Drechslerella stenobrocha 248 TaxID=1043628 RepID=W7I701_9PEZI|nr:hypothetical protein DRE_06508 [Drechslerella stenobrocha 248]